MKGRWRRSGWFAGLAAAQMVVTVSLTGCGGGGDGGGPDIVLPKTITGVAAAGAPITGRAYLRDSSHPTETLGPADIASDGGFSFDVINLTAPFYLQAEGVAGGQSYKLHSVAMADGTANINPLTNLAVAAAAGVNDPEAVFNDPAANPVLSSALDKAIADIKAAFQPLLDAYSADTDFLTGSFVADHSGLDGMLDAIEVEIDATTGVVAVNDRTTDTTLASMTTTTIDAPSDGIDSTEAEASASTGTLEGCIAGKRVNLSEGYFQFNADGTWIGEFEYGWTTPGVYDVSDYGTYTVNGWMVTLTPTGGTSDDTHHTTLTFDTASPAAGDTVDAIDYGNYLPLPDIGSYRINLSDGYFQFYDNGTYIGEFEESSPGVYGVSDYGDWTVEGRVVTLTRTGGTSTDTHHTTLTFSSYTPAPGDTFDAVDYGDEQETLVDSNPRVTISSIVVGSNPNVPIVSIEDI